jgi:hypothetical protein
MFGFCKKSELRKSTLPDDRQACKVNFKLFRKELYDYAKTNEGRIMNTNGFPVYCQMAFRSPGKRRQWNKEVLEKIWSPDTPDLVMVIDGWSG